MSNVDVNLNYGVDPSLEMIRHAKLRRGITLVEADAMAMTFPTARIDFTSAFASCWIART